MSKFSFFVFGHTRLQFVTLTTMEVFYLLSLRSIACLHWFKFHKSGFKSTLVVLPCPTMQVLVEDVVYVSQCGIPMYVWDALYLWICDDPGLISWSDQIVGAAACSHQSFSSKLLTPKDVSSFILVNITNRSHQVNSRSMIGPCFAVVVYDETRWPMLNVHLSYKPPYSWRIIFWSGGCPRQFSGLNFSGLWHIPKGPVVRG